MKKFLFIAVRRNSVVSLAFFLCMLFNTNSFGQTLNCYAVFSDSARATNSLLGSFFINGVDTTNTDQVELKVGSAEGDSSAVFQVVDFDNPSGLPTGFSYTRSEDNLIVQVSSAQALWTYYCSVRIKNSSGVWGAPFRFIAN